jgi:hypothetical protein
MPSGQKPFSLGNDTSGSSGPEKSIQGVTSSPHPVLSLYLLPDFRRPLGVYRIIEQLS